MERRKCIICGNVFYSNNRATCTTICKEVNEARIKCLLEGKPYDYKTELQKVKYKYRKLEDEMKIEFNLRNSNMDGVRQHQWVR